MPTRKIYTNTFAQILSKVLTAIISIAMIKMLTNYLDIAGYGLYSKIYNYLSLFAVIADLGLYTITVREISSHIDDVAMQRKISSNVLTLRTLSGGIIILLSLALGAILPGYDTPIGLIGILIAGGFTLSGLMNSSMMSYLQATLHTEFSLISNTLGKLSTFLLIFLAMRYTGDMPHGERFIIVMLAGLVGNIVMTLLTWWYMSRWIPVRFGWDQSYMLHIVRTSLPYGLALFLNVIFFKVDTILLSLMTETNLADTVVALYSLPMKIVEVGMMYSTIFLNSLLPVLTLAFAKKDTKKIHSLIRHAVIILTLGGSVATGVLFFAADSIIPLISTEAYASLSVLGGTSIEALRIVAWIFLIYSLSALSTYILIAQNQQRKMLTINTIIALINIIGNILIIPYYSFIGSAWVTLISQVLLLILTSHAAWKYLGKGESQKTL